jgi:hypothetical protein
MKRSTCLSLLSLRFLTKMFMLAFLQLGNTCLPVPRTAQLHLCLLITCCCTLSALTCYSQGDYQPPLFRVWVITGTARVGLHVCPSSHTHYSPGSRKTLLFSEETEVRREEPALFLTALGVCSNCQMAGCQGRAGRGANWVWILLASRLP